MGPNDVKLLSVYTRKAGGTIADVSLPVDSDFEVVVEVKAGYTVFGDGTLYETGIVLRDFAANDLIPANPARFGPEGMASAGQYWPNQANRFVYTVAAANLVGRENHICELLAFLRVRVTDPDVAFVTGHNFIIMP